MLHRLATGDENPSVDAAMAAAGKQAPAAVAPASAAAGRRSALSILSGNKNIPESTRAKRTSSGLVKPAKTEDAGDATMMLVDGDSHHHMMDEALFGEGETPTPGAAGPAEPPFSNGIIVPPRPEGVIDIDASDAHDPQSAPDYVWEIMVYMHSVEAEFQPDISYMAKHPEINWSHRATLVNWLVEVHWRYKLVQETLFLAVNIMDRYMSVAEMPVPRHQFQLVGLTSLLLATKFEEISVPLVEEWAQVADNFYEAGDIIQMERNILRALHFKFGFPSPMTFLRRISKTENYDIQTRTVGKYLLEVALMAEQMMPFSPSVQAAASALLSRRMLNRTPHWDAALTYYSRYDEASLRACVNALVGVLRSTTLLTAPGNPANADRNKAAYKKYASARHLRASLFVEKHIRENYA
ncbi:hypothetical protein H696_02272 [Fonticula alba]|uniref:Uncharacterized protein n=1 Tax=Fonticula alba TaxID=691883 RepID=A0A058ZD12_FONAL|nr:hypothetical protein H696_02272 [Fonticula alba]KCV71327.1 hypothetical protein H696_02272 [Fonticula alba]|eukprot:XP_009494450.1 hypothetical protein H696_02272 [Fonticula alba]